MGKSELSIRELFDAYVKATQYIMRQTFNQDEFVHFSGVAHNFFGADFVAFFNFSEAKEVTLSQCSCIKEEFCETLVCCYSKIVKDVAESDFISVDTLLLPEPYGTICLPLHISSPATVVLIGYKTEEPLSKDLLNLYLALSAMIETVLMRSREIEARALSQRDLLTTLYNKLTTESLIETYLKNDGVAGKHGIIMLDIDNFKKVNDNFGHAFGDKIITELAAHLKIAFRETDILGRIGGDEFIIFMKNYKELKQIEEKMEQIRRSFAKSYKGKTEAFELTISLGIALYPEHGISFEELYIKSDKALYQSKDQGKNRYSLYDGN